MCEPFKIDINRLLEHPAAENLKRIMNVISALQKKLYSAAADEAGGQRDLIRIGTVFQIFLIDTLAAGKRPGELTAEDWKQIAEKVYQHAVVEDDRQYSLFVFSLYADYIDISADVVAEKYRLFEAAEGQDPGTAEQSNTIGAIREIAAALRRNAELLQSREISEVHYVEDCLWLSLEAMIKLLSAWLTTSLDAERAQLVQAVTQLAFEYGRYVLYAKEQAMLESYLQNQRVLDEKLRRQYDEFLAELQENADRFQDLIDKAFSADLRKALQHSAELARAAGVREEEILKTIEDVDAFFEQ